MDGDEKVCFLQIRHRPSHGADVPEHMASHIYYEVEEKFRGKGYAKKMLALGLEEAKKVGLSEIFITCDEDNVASKSVIEANRGILLEQAQLPSNGKILLKYRISLS